MGLGLWLGSGLGLGSDAGNQFCWQLWQLLVVGLGRVNVSRRVRAVAVPMLGFELA